MVTAETVVSEEMTVYPVIGEKAEEIHITAKVNGGESLGGETLAKVVEKANMTAEGVTSLVIESWKSNTGRSCNIEEHDKTDKSGNESGRRSGAD